MDEIVIFFKFLRKQLGYMRRVLKLLLGVSVQLRIVEMFSVQRISLTWVRSHALDVMDRKKHNDEKSRMSEPSIIEGRQSLLRYGSDFHCLMPSSFGAVGTLLKKLRKSVKTLTPS